MFKAYILILFTFLLQNCVFAQSYNFETNKKSYSVFRLSDSQQEVDYLFIYKDNTNGFEFEVLDKDLNFISKGEYKGDYFYQVLDYIKSIKKVGDKIAISKLYIHQNSYSYPVETSYLFDIRTGKFEKLFYQNNENITVSENPLNLHFIFKSKLANSYTSFTPFFKDNIKVHAETSIMSKVMLFANIKESNIKIVDETGKVEHEFSFTKPNDKALQYLSLINVVDDKSFFIESNFETKRKFSHSNLLVYNNHSESVESKLELNQDQKPYLEIKSISKNNENYILLGLYKAATKFSSDISDKPYAGIFRWVIDKNGNTISRNLFGWTRLVNQLNYFVGKEEGQSNYLYPIISFETKNGYSIILKDKNEDVYSNQKNNQFIINFDENHQLISSKNYLQNKNELVDYFYDTDKKEIKILEFEKLNKHTQAMRITNENNKSLFFVALEENSLPFFFMNQNKVLLITSKDKNNAELKVLSIN